MRWRNAIVGLLCGGGLLLPAHAEPAARPGAIEAIPFGQLSDRTLGEAGRRALAIVPEQWNHAETEHFVIHFQNTFIATPVALEAEFYFRFITADLDVKPPEGEGKSHLYLFEDAAQWAAFVRDVELEEWTGAVNIGGELFVPRNPKIRFKGHALGHEVSHLLVNRYLGRHLPLWLGEGYAEDVGLRGYIAFNRARGYGARPWSAALENPLPLRELTALQSYPAGGEIGRFYLQSYKLVRFLNPFGQQERFRKLLRECAGGTPFESALSRAYGTRWSSLSDLEEDFQKELAR